MVNDPKSMFRKAALDKLASPEQLDVLMQITSPRTWAMLYALAGLVLLVIVWSITVAEIVSGVLLILGRCVRWGVAALLFIDVMGIVIIHARLGWFVGEHGTGGVEYSLALAVSLLTIAAADREKNSTYSH